MYKHFFKRVIDIVLASIAFIGFLLVFIFAAPAIYLTDKGPIFYNAARRGKNGKSFKMYKFRSMYVNSPDIRNADGSTYNGENDPRVTKIGKLMRKTSIDELPQVINVLKGDMSIVGPRPTLAIKPYSEIENKKRYEVRPGITGYSQAYYRNSITQDEKFSYDEYYVDNVSFWLDVKIVFKTFFGVLAHKNIYVAAPQTNGNVAETAVEKTEKETVVK